MDNRIVEQYPEWYSEIPPLQQEKYIEVYGAFIERFARAVRAITNTPLHVYAVPTYDRMMGFDSDFNMTGRITVNVSVRTGEERWGWEFELSVRVMQHDQWHYMHMVHRFIKAYADKMMFFLEREILS